MTDSIIVGPVVRPYASAADLTEEDLKTVKERLETVGLEPSRLLAKWMEDTMGLKFVIPEKEEKRMQIERSATIKDVVKRIRTELGPISGVDPINA